MKSIRILRVTRKPELGEDLSGEPWREAPWYEGFREPDKPEEKAEPDTSFCMVHDGEELYVAVRAHEPQMEQVKAHAAEASDTAVLWRENQIMLSIDAEGLGRSCAHLAADSEGRIASVWQRGRANLRTWGRQVRHVVQLQKDSWSAQIAIPLHVLKFSPESSQWLVSVRRNRSFDPTSRWSRGCTFFVSDDENGICGRRFFGRAEVEGLDVVDFLWDVEAVGRVGRSDEERDGVLQQRLKITNLASKGRAVRVHCSLEGHDKGTVFERRFGPGEAIEELIEMRSASGGADFLHVTLTDPASSRPVFRHVYFVEQENLSWKPHSIRQSDGHGGEVCHTAKFRFMPRWHGMTVIPYGLAQMDNGEIAFAGMARDSDCRDRQTLVAFSGDAGGTWTPYQCVKGFSSRPMMLAYLGDGVLSCWGGRDGVRYRLFGRDYGRTWEAVEDRVVSRDPTLPTEFSTEGNPLVDRDERGVVTSIAETGCAFVDAESPLPSSREFIRWSYDLGRTWEDISEPEAWKWQESYRGKTYARSVSEGALVRAANGWIVAALRTDMLPCYFNHPIADDSLEGTAVSISKDDGETWSPMQRLFDAGRHHANLIRLSNGDLVMTLIRRVDIRDGKLASYRRGCDAVVSRDNGLTWDVDHMITLDDFPYCEGENWVHSECGHLFSIALEDDSVLTAYGNYIAGGALIHWSPPVA